MARDARTSFVSELLSEFVEDHVRQAPRQAFGLRDVKQALGGMLQEAEVPITLRPTDDPWLEDCLEHHPLLRRQATTPPTWKPGLNVGAVR